ncbi:DUF192 domain-containing protein [Candidatus Saccharibacteria bacterium]|jgi:uncharacterized membrane protein (UPF0127 family)|nr:DUF192 domain-containing protein [Candidatus Saccharibacteria bacterium]
MQNDLIKKIKSVRKRVIISGGILVLAFIAVALFVVPSSNNKNATKSHKSRAQAIINNTVISLEIANSSQKQKKGLCCRDYLQKDSGMLFVYERPAILQFWMKDTRIPLDMYWINEKKEIIYIEHNVRPESYPKSFGPAVPALYVLETNAGYAKEHRIHVGQIVQLDT